MGKFDDDGFTIRFQEKKEGSIMTLLDKVIRQLDYKFLIRNITFEGQDRNPDVTAPCRTKLRNNLCVNP